MREGIPLAPRKAPPSFGGLAGCALCAAVAGAPAGGRAGGRAGRGSVRGGGGGRATCTSHLQAPAVLPRLKCFVSFAKWHLEFMKVVRSLERLSLIVTDMQDIEEAHTFRHH